MTEFATAVRATADDALALSEAVSSFFSLLTSDHAWTALLSMQAEAPGERNSALMLSLSRLLRDLVASRAGASWLQDFVVRTGARSILAAIDDARQSVDDKEFRASVTALLETYGDELGPLTEGGYRGFIGSETKQFVALLEDGRAVLQDEGTQGDLFKNVLCSAASLMIVGGMVTTAIPPHVQGPVIAGVGVSAFKAFKCRLEELEDGKGWCFGNA